MDVELYVYDLSQGLARQYSQALTGVQIDAIYHTAIVFGGVEYFFGQGVHRKVPGSTHHGRPMKVVKLGRTELPREIINEYLESLEGIYTAESYDLFLHNCNNFSQDLAVFLVGKSIPDEIRNLPETFLRTPIGQMLRGQLDQSMRRMTQAPDAVSGQNANGTVQPVRATVNGHSAVHVQPAAFRNGIPRKEEPGRVHYPQSTAELDRLLNAAKSSCAVIFFTSATCPPCKIVYPTYDELAAESGSKAILIKVDVSKVYDIATRYQVRATPTFYTLLKGQKDQEWSGADPGRLRGNVRLLVQMAHPQHPHTQLNLPTLHSKIERPALYTKVPPIDKLLNKIGQPAQDKPVQQLVHFIQQREKEGVINAPVCDLQGFSDWFSDKFAQLSAEVHFAVIDLVRIAAADPRVSSFLAGEKNFRTLKSIIPEGKDFTTTPYNVQAVTLQLCCNMFGAVVWQDAVQNRRDPHVKSMLEQVASQCLLAEHNNARSLAAALIFNMSASEHNDRVDGVAGADAVMEDLEAALVDAIVREEQNKDTLHSLLLALGLLLYMTPVDSSIWDLCIAMDVRASLKQKSKMPVFAKEPLLREIGEELLAKGGPS